tara:strand:+ start:138 stop:1007 length:870 start_codon:yes stop_codon:yes gene_type:complete
MWLREYMPIKSANHLNKILNIFHSAHGGDRFPVDVDTLALGAHEIFQWPDPIMEIQQAAIKNFEGMLACNEDLSKWLIVYNASLASKGRIRFTKAHELGHYVLHRKLRQEFMCSREDMLAWSGEGSIEADADTFASYLLMPLDDFRAQATGNISLDMFSHCADRYGVSLTAAILKWLSYTDQKAVLLMSNDGFINWASSSNPAYKAGAYFKTRNNVIPVPDGSLTANDLVAVSAEGEQVSAKKWFPYADTDADLTEMKIYSEQYDSTLTLLILPKYAEFWPPQDQPSSS